MPTLSSSSSPVRTTMFQRLAILVAAAAFGLAAPAALAASPAYLARHGTPRTLDELARHRVVHYAPALSGHDGRWEYVDPADGRTRFHPVRAAVVVNGTDAYQAAALAGLGLYQAPAKGVREHVAQGRLVEVLPGFVPAPMPVSLLYPHRRQLTPRVQAVLAWLEAVVGPSLDG